MIDNLYAHLKQWLGSSSGLFLLISIPSILIFLLIVPASWGLDEQVHTARAYQIADGGLYPEINHKDSKYGGVISKSLVDVIHHGWYESNQADRQLQFYDERRSDLKSVEHSKEIGSVPINGDKEYFEFGTTGPYAPVLYLPAAAGMKLAMVGNLSVDGAIFLSRAFQALVYIGIVFMALRLLSKYRAQWLLFVVALLPASLYQAATLNADAITNSFVILFMAVLLQIFLQRSRIKTVQSRLLWVSALALMFTKPSFAIFLALIWLIPSAQFATKITRVSLQIVLPVVCAILFLAISLKGLAYSDAMHVYFTSEQASRISLFGQIGYVLQHPIDFVVVLAKTVVSSTDVWHQSLIGLMGYNTVPVPYPMLVLASVTVVFAALYVDKMPRYISWGLLILGTLSALSVVFLLYGTFNQVGAVMIAGVQGRYFIPCLIVAGLGLGGLMRYFVDVKVLRPHIVFALPSATVVVSSLFAYAMAVM